MSLEIVEALKGLEREQGINHKVMLKNIEEAMLVAYNKTDSAVDYAIVELDDQTGEFRVFELLIPDDILDQLLSEDEKPVKTIDPETGEYKFEYHFNIDYSKLSEFEADIEKRDVTPASFSRIAASTARQVVHQKIRKINQEQVFDDYKDKIGTLDIGTVKQVDQKHALIQLKEGVDAMLPASEMVEGERYNKNSKLKVVIKDVRHNEKGYLITVSRRSPSLVKALFEYEVPEMQNDLVEIIKVVREPGLRAKIGVIAKAQGIDPVGACVGPRGSRVRNIVSELAGEKVDIIPLDVDPGKYLAKSLSPAKVKEVLLDEEDNHAIVVVPDDQVSQAIGSGGHNARLTSQLTGWAIDVRSQTEQANLMADSLEDEAEDYADNDGGCICILANGNRCPNAALEGTLYCGLPKHQVLSLVKGRYTAKIASLTEDEIQALLTNSEAYDEAMDKLVELSNAE